MDWLWVLLVAVRGLSPNPDDQWATRLTAIDRVRAEAFSSADPSRLDEVYTGASAARRADTRVIEAYAQRDGRVVGAELQVLSCRFVRATGDRVRLDVIDRLGPAHVVWGDGTSTRLPRDEPSRHALTLVRTAAGWRIATSQQVSVGR